VFHGDETGYDLAKVDRSEIDSNLSAPWLPVSGSRFRAKDLLGVHSGPDVAEERRSALGIHQQALDLEVEFRVSAAGSGEKGISFRGGQFTGLGEKFLGGSRHIAKSRVSRRKKRTGKFQVFFSMAR
jgi:hypothetical protein